MSPQAFALIVKASEIVVNVLAMSIHVVVKILYILMGGLLLVPVLCGVEYGVVGVVRHLPRIARVVLLHPLAYLGR